jgi:hypothetical protein
LPAARHFLKRLKIDDTGFIKIFSTMGDRARGRREARLRRRLVNNTTRLPPVLNIRGLRRRCAISASVP